MPHKAGLNAYLHKTLEAWSVETGKYCYIFHVLHFRLGFIDPTQRSVKCLGFYLNIGVFLRDFTVLFPYMFKRNIFCLSKSVTSKLKGGKLVIFEPAKGEMCANITQKRPGSGTSYLDIIWCIPSHIF